MTDLRPLHDWSGPPAMLTLWCPSAASMESAKRAPVSPALPSYEQEQHLHAFRACEQRHEAMARLLVVVWEEPGRCDPRAMTHVVTAHLRRHDTYHSWFEERDGAIVRHILTDPAAIQMEPMALGEVRAEDWQKHVMATPAPFAWDCFRFGILQRANGFTFFASIDHLHADATVIAFLMTEIRSAYRAVLDGEGPLQLGQPGSYLDYCGNQRQRAAATTLADPEVTRWIAFLHRNSGRMPAFALPLGVPEDRYHAEYVHVDILEDAVMDAFESACHAAGARAIGGLLACAALTERELAGRSRYSVVTPTTTRRSPQAFRTTGWCVGVVPIDFDVQQRTFPELALIAQDNFDERLNLADIPIDLVLELAAGLPTVGPAATGGVMLSYMDVNVAPLSAHIAREWHQANGRVYINQGIAAQVAIWLFRTQRGLSLTAAYPANSTARASMHRYVAAFAGACRMAADALMPTYSDVGRER
ncbi:condensation domain-containing protein [Bradyrhizobium symbiodeficiens]|uniref:Condensation domain-containing protein n=1 Tax=Bradyrhizobium symbiodeficiens TaxID=1404367 RepID=A0A6G8ZP48_9BRAD|nr:condensation domain-containing protein [Bradyrhizobium symbiodeficiens]QIP02012.1 acyltransferase [Bradyrhizobium symbiodeficiens]QIP08318.1 acyltransferase [Bradyrhizobium symbiodeficiens]